MSSASNAMKPGAGSRKLGAGSREPGAGSRRGSPDRPRSPIAGHEWLLLLYLLPAKHSPARVKAWRRLQRVGAVPLKNSAYVLPTAGDAREDLEWIRAEIASIGGQAMVLAATALDDGTRNEIVETFRAARAADYQALHDEVAALARASSHRRQPLARRALVQSLRRLRERLREIEAIDFFEANGRQQAARLLEDLDRRIRRPPMTAHASVQPAHPASYRGRLWITRPRPGVDRMSSAWLIRRFIDPQAKFAFGDAATPKSVPFDMFGVEFGHHGSACTFETLVSRFAITDAAVAWIAQIVHDLDLKEDTHGLAETAAVGRMVEGLRRMHHDDATLLEEGIKMFEALYQSFDRAVSRKGDAVS